MSYVDWVNQQAYVSGGLGSIPRAQSDSVKRRMRVHVVRNQPVEALTRFLRRLGGYFEAEIIVTLSPYDESFSSPVPSDVDVILFWIDRREEQRNGDELVAEFLGVRQDPEIPRALLLDDQLGESAIAQWARSQWIPIINIPNDDSAALSSLSGLSMSSTTMLSLARDILLKALSRAIFGIPKLVVVDLDNTLYRGVLSEDGLEGLDFSDGHVLLNERLSDIAKSGVHVVILSRNRAEDLSELDANWPDQLIQRDLVSRVVGVDSGKGAALVDLISEFRTTPESVLVVDDNPGELSDMLMNCDGFWPVFAQEPLSAARIVEAQAWRVQESSTDTARARRQDARQAEQRSELMEAVGSLQDLHQKLETRIVARLANSDDVARIAELSERVNQFNTNVQRFSVAEIEDLLKDSRYQIGLCEVSDKLSDSGTVGALVLRRDDPFPIVTEFLLSCRILGRGLEDALAVALLACVGVVDGSAAFMWRDEERNTAARAWLRDAGNEAVTERHVVTRSVLALRNAVSKIGFNVEGEGSSLTHGDQ